MKAYPTYKDSGVQWLGDVPSSWNVFPAKQVFADCKERRWEEDSFLTASQKYGVISQQRYMQLIGGRIVQASQDFDKWKHVEPDDFVISLRSFQGGLEMCAERGCVTWHYVVLKPKMEIIPLYFKWLFKSYSYIKSLQSTCNFIRDGQDLRYSNFVQVPIPFPPLTEQKAIATFINKKCAEIEELISRRQSIIERLRELKQSIIAEAVTKGLNPDVPMKDSGIAWLGEVPQHWNIERLQWHLREIKEINSPIKTNRVLSLTNKKGVIPYEEKGNQGNKAKASHDEYKLAYPDTLVMNSMNVIIGSVGICNYFGCVSPVYYIFKTAGETMLSFVNYVFQTTRFQKELRRHAKGILEIRLRLSSDDILKQLVAFPPLHEQQSIVAYLDKKCSDIDELVARQEQIIEKLKELKTSTIAHVVTGKVDVRDAI